MIKSANAEADKILKDAAERADQAYQYTRNRPKRTQKHVSNKLEKQIEREHEQMLQNAKDEVAALTACRRKLVEKV